MGTSSDAIVCQVKLLAKHCAASMKISAMVFGPQIHWDLAQFGSTWCTLTLHIELVKLANVLLELSEVFWLWWAWFKKTIPSAMKSNGCLNSLHRTVPLLDCNQIVQGYLVQQNWTPVIKQIINRIGFLNSAFVISNISISIQGRSSPVPLDKVNRWKLLEPFKSCWQKTFARKKMCGWSALATSETWLATSEKTTNRFGEMVRCFLFPFQAYPTAPPTPKRCWKPSARAHLLPATWDRSSGWQSSASCDGCLG